MPRRKNVKRNIKRQMNKSATKPSGNIEKLQKVITQIPIKLAAQLNKDVLVLKQKENKLKTAINKNRAQLKTSENRVKLAAKTKDSSAGKKQLRAAKKMHAETLKDEIRLNKQLKNLTKIIDQATQQQNKLVALRKHLNQFEKDWNEKQKSPKPKKFVRKNKQTLQKPDEETNNEPFHERMVEEARIDEATELTS